MDGHSFNPYKRVRAWASDAPSRGNKAGMLDPWAGFTLLEILVSLAILVTAFAIIWSTFSATLNGWRRGRKMLEQLHQGDFVMEQLVSALRSAAFFPDRSGQSGRYGFWLKSRGSGSSSSDRISWVTSGTAFLQPDSPLANGLHRLEFTIESDDEGRPAVAIRAYPHLAEEEDWDDTPWFVSDELIGFRCRVWDKEEKRWSREWEDTNSVPRLIELTLYLKPEERYGEAPRLKRLVEIPVAPPLDGSVLPAAGEEGARAQPQQEPE